MEQLNTYLCPLFRRAHTYTFHLTNMRYVFLVNLATVIGQASLERKIAKTLDFSLNNAKPDVTSVRIETNNQKDQVAVPWLLILRMFHRKNVSPYNQGPTTKKYKPRDTDKIFA